MQFECPVCQKALQKTTYEGTNTYPCAGGCGTFLGRKNLRIIEESRETSIAMASVPKSGAERGSVKACPKCKGEMAKRNYGELDSTVIDYCASCQGIWLDPGELERIQVFYEAANEFNEARENPAATPAFACPECQTQQVKQDVCSNCGLVFARHRAREQESQARQAAGAATASQLESVFANLLGVDVEQKYHLTEALINFERKNLYRLTLMPTDARAGEWRIEEQNRSLFSILGRNLFGLLYTFTMHVKDGLGNVVMRLHRKPRLYFHEVEVYDDKGVECGLIRRAFSFFHRVIKVDNARGQRQLRIVGPIWSPWTFNVYDGRKKVAIISKKWSGLLKEAYTDADKFSIRFEAPLAGCRKRLSLAALMLVDSLYFEGKKGFLGHFVSAPGIQLLFAVVVISWWVKHF